MTPKWRVERSRAGTGWIVTDPGGFGFWMPTWNAAMESVHASFATEVAS